MEGRTHFKEEKMDFAFVQYFEVVDLIDEIEREAGCITVRWERGSYKIFEGRSLFWEGMASGK